MPVKRGMLVRDDFGRQDIVCSRKDRPSQDWIDEQLHADDIRKLIKVWHVPGSGM